MKTMYVIGGIVIALWIVSMIGLLDPAEVCRLEPSWNGLSCA